jgi:hypothetical protein
MTKHTFIRKIDFLDCLGWIWRSFFFDLLAAIMNQPTFSPKILKTAIPPHLTKNFHRVKSNSTSSLFINSTLNAPDNEEIVRWWVQISPLSLSLSLFSSTSFQQIHMIVFLVWV